MDYISSNIKRDTFLVFTLSKLVGTFPYNVRSLKLSKIFSLWSFVVFATILRCLIIAFSTFKIKTDDKIEFYTVFMLRFLICLFFVSCLVLFCHLFTIGSKLRSIFEELNDVRSHLTQLSCGDVDANKIASKQLLTVSLFLLTNLATLIYRITTLWKFGVSLTYALYLINLTTFSSILQCTNLLDVVKHYLNIINVELIDISNNQDKQHFIKLYKSRICVQHNMLPEKHISRRKLKVLAQLHFSLCKLCDEIVNRAYSLSLFILMLIQSSHLTCSLYLILVLVLQKESLIEVLHHVIYFYIWAIYSIFVLVWIIHHCESTKQAGLSLLELVYHKIIYNEAPALNSELMHFLNCICNHTIRFRALNVFEIDYTVLSNVIGAVITYGVILVQLSFAT